MATILVADDEEAIRLLLKANLERAGHSVVEAANGLEACETVQRRGPEIDLVLIDMMMPVMSGAQAVERIRQVQPQARIVCMSAFTTDEIPQDILFLKKPFTHSSLADVIGAALAA